MKRVICTILCIVMVVSLCPFTVSAENNIRWSFNSTTGELSITGTGAAAFYESGYETTPPWQSVKSQIKSVTVYAGITALGYHAFSDCTELTDVSLPSTLVGIGNYAFYNCSKAKITLSENFTSIGNSAFYNCDGITGEVDLKNVEYLGEDAFRACSNITKIVYRSNLINSYLHSAFSGCSGVTEIIFPADFNYPFIPVGAFSGCAGLTSITIPDCVKSIERDAFSNCANLQYVNITEHSLLETIGQAAFNQCSKLESAEIIKKAVNINKWAFANCTSLNDFEFSDNAECIDSSAFENTGFYNNSDNWENGILYHKARVLDVAYKIGSECIIKEGTKVIGNKAFNGHSEITSISLPEGLQKIEDDAFLGCSRIKSVYIPQSVTDIGSHAFGYDISENYHYYFTGNVLISGYRNSAAYWYAIDNNFAFTNLCTHNYEVVNIVSPTCVDRGYTNFKCSLCGETLIGNSTLPLGHTYSTEYTIDVRPTETLAGSKSHHCTVCGGTDTPVMIPALGGKCGDANCDGKVNAVDIIKIKLHLAGKTILTGNAIVLADVNFDEKVNAMDILQLKLAMAGKIML